MLTLAVMMVAIIVPAGGLAREREAGTIEEVLVMPFRSWQLMLASVLLPHSPDPGHLRDYGPGGKHAQSDPFPLLP